MGTVWTKEERVRLAQKLFEALGEGKRDDEVARNLGVSGDDYEELKGTMFKLKAEELRRKPSEQVYCEYILAQMANIHDLTAMVNQFRKSNQYSAMVGAVRARADILDRIIDRGQEFDLVVRKPEEKRIVAGVLVANLSNEQLKTAIVRELGNMNKLIKSVAEGSIVEIEPGEIYTGHPSSPPPEVTLVREPAKKNARANNAKVFTGRRVVKQKMIVAPMGEASHEDG